VRFDIRYKSECETRANDSAAVHVYVPLGRYRRCAWLHGSGNLHGRRQSLPYKRNHRSRRWIKEDARGAAEHQVKRTVPIVTALKISFGQQ